MSTYLIPIGLGIINFALVYLTFVNDEHLAGVFHGEAWAWGIVIHAAILLMPAINGFLPEGEEREAGQFIWKACIALAYLGNVVGSIAFASGVPVRDVLNGNVPIGIGLIGASVIGGLLLPTMESYIGWLFERRFAAMAHHFSQWLAGDLDLHTTATTIEHQEVRFEPQPQMQPLPDFVPPPLPIAPAEVATHNNIIPFQAQAPQPRQRAATPDSRRAVVESLIAEGVLDNATLYLAYGATTEADKSRVRNIKTAATKTALRQTV